MKTIRLSSIYEDIDLYRLLNYRTSITAASEKYTATVMASVWSTFRPRMTKSTFCEVTPRFLTSNLTSLDIPLALTAVGGDSEPHLLLSVFGMLNESESGLPVTRSMLQSDIKGHTSLLNASIKSAFGISIPTTKEGFLLHHPVGDTSIVYDIHPFHPIRDAYGFQAREKMQLSYIISVRHHLLSGSLEVAYSQMYIEGSESGSLNIKILAPRYLRFWTATDMIEALEATGAYSQYTYFFRDGHNLLWEAPKIPDFGDGILAAVLAVR